MKGLCKTSVVCCGGAPPGVVDCDQCITGTAPDQINVRLSGFTLNYTDGTYVLPSTTVVIPGASNDECTWDLEVGVFPADGINDFHAELSVLPTFPSTTGFFLEVATGNISFPVHAYWYALPGVLGTLDCFAVAGEQLMDKAAGAPSWMGDIYLSIP